MNHQLSLRTPVLLLVLLAPALSLATPPALAQDETLSERQLVQLGLHAALVLPDEFCSKSVKKGGMWTGKDKFEFEGLICPEAEAMAKRVFRTVTLLDHMPLGNVADAQVLLRPELKDVNATKSVTAWGKREIVIILEWTAFSVAGDVLWLQTVQGTAENKTGTNFTAKKKFRKNLKAAVQDVMVRSAEVLTAAPELRSLAMP